MTWHRSALGMIRHNGKGTSSRGPVLLVEGRRSIPTSLGSMSIRGGSNEAEDNTDEKFRFRERRRSWFHHYRNRHLRSTFWNRGGATEDEIATSTFSTSTSRKRDFSLSTTSSLPSSEIGSNDEIVKGSSRTTSISMGSQTYQTSVGSKQGYRSHMEDEFFVSNHGDFVAVFDGHGGPAVSRYLRKNLYANVQAFLPLVLQEQEESILDEVAEADDTEDLNSNYQNSEDIGASEEKKMDDNKEAMERNSAPSSGVPSSRRRRAPTVDDYANALASALHKVDSEILKISHWSFQGSTAIVIWMYEESDEKADESESESSSSRRTILASNIGDSRAVLCRGDKAWDLSRDHKPDDPVERSRIEERGGKVVWCGDTDEFGEPIEATGVYRVNGSLALARAIGDRSERPHVTADPEIISVDVEEDDQFIVIASDGLWDVMESAEAIDFVKLSLKAGVAKDKIADVMVEEALRLGTWDNVTVVIIWIDPTL